MGPPVSSIVANLYVEYFEQKALCTASHPQAMAPVCVVIQKEERSLKS